MLQKLSLKSTIYIVLAVTIIRLLVIGFPELSNDEAHYALYGYYLDWSYFDHPPLVGWLNALVLTLAASDFALRLIPVMLALLNSYLIYQLTITLFPNLPKYVANNAVLLFQIPILLQVLGLVLLPDTPLIPIVLAIALVLFRVQRHPSVTAWLVLGLLFGLAGLSKYTAITVVVSVIFSLLLFKNYKIILTPAPWLAFLIAAILITPIVYWNWQHDWISIRYQLGHGIPDKDWQLQKFFESQLGQIIAFTPAFFIFGWLALFSNYIKPTPKMDHDIVLSIRYLGLFALPILILFGFNGGYEHSLLHWTALAWAILTPVIAVYLHFNWQRLWVRLLSYVSIGYALLLFLVLNSLLVFDWLPFDNNKHPLNDLYGWQQVATRAKIVLAEKYPNNNQANAGKLFIGNWSVFSRLAWYARPIPVIVTDTRQGQSDLWYGAPQKGDHGILIVPPKYRYNKTDNGIAKFKSCEFIETIESKIADKIAASYDLYQCDRYHGRAHSSWLKWGS